MRSLAPVLLMERSTDPGPIGPQHVDYVIRTLTAVAMWVDRVSGASDRDGFGCTRPPMSPLNPFPGTRFACQLSLPEVHPFPLSFPHDA
jgi:hypothetical protein